METYVTQVDTKLRNILSCSKPTLQPLHQHCDFLFLHCFFSWASEDRLFLIPTVLSLLAEIAEFIIELGERDRKLATGSNFVLDGTIKAKSRTTYKRWKEGAENCRSRKGSA